MEREIEMDAIVLLVFEITFQPTIKTISDPDVCGSKKKIIIKENCQFLGKHPKSVLLYLCVLSWSRFIAITMICFSSTHFQGNALSSGRKKSEKLEHFVYFHLSIFVWNHLFIEVRAQSASFDSKITVAMINSLVLVIAHQCAGIKWRKWVKKKRNRQQKKERKKKQFST